jgi:SPP1 family phage portal protein
MNINVITYQDFLEEPNKGYFVQQAISKHKNMPQVKFAKTAREYFKQHNETIMKFQKLMYKVSGQAIPDNFSSNYKLRSNFFNRFTTQEVQYLLGNGTTWEDDKTADKVGKDFDYQLQKISENAIISGVAFGFWNLDHLEVFDLPEFCPIWDEEDGSLKAGIRYWQLDNSKPVRATLYELDGYTEYMWSSTDDVSVIQEKKSYKQVALSTPADGTEIYDLENYNGFPIVPLWNVDKKSSFDGMQENIDCYDLIKSGFANTVDEASYIYWAIQNAGGMDDLDLATFVERMKSLHAALVEDSGAKAEPHTIEAPYASREALLDRLRNDLYEDAMALDTKTISGGAVTATQIMAAYEPLNSKTDKFEYLVIKFIDNILSLAGIEDEPTFTRSKIVNVQEEIQVLIQSSAYLPQDYVTTKIATLLGDGNQAEALVTQMYADDMNRLGEGEE